MSFNFGYSYDDILIKPRLSIVESRREISLDSKLTRNIRLKTPIISANMDTVTESNMAIDMAKIGGVGIIHRYCSIEDQVQMIKKVKKNINFFIENPICIESDKLVKDYIEIVEKTGIKTIIVTDKNKKFLGIINKYNINTFNAVTPSFNLENQIISNLMSDQKHYQTITKNEFLKNLTRPKNYQLLIQKMKEFNVNYLPVVDNNENKKIEGLITLKDLLFYSDKRSNANLDKDGNLIVGAAIGVNGDYLDRAKALIDAKCDFLVLDIAHGHSILVPKVIKNIKEIKNIDIIAGNVATAEGVKFLAEAGADGIKVNIGAGSICTTRIVTGCGVPQFTAVLECAQEAKKFNIPIIADGGHCNKIGNMVKALSAGASCCMLGRMLAGTDQSPGKIIVKDGKKVKVIRGMAGYITNLNKKRKLNENDNLTSTPEGVEGYIDYRGDVVDIIEQMKGGIRSGLSYCGVKSINQLHQENIEYYIISLSGKYESGNHGIKLIG
jgi:IMP dehydrogenase